MSTKSETLARAIEQSGRPEAERGRLTTLLGSADLDTWFETVDNSPYALVDWIRALGAFDAWLTEQAIEARPVDSMIGYLECCTLAAAETLALPEFAALARENLDRYGFDATRPADA